MGTLGHRALLQYIESNDLAGLKTFLDTRHLPVDDRDEVSTLQLPLIFLSFYLIFKKLNFFKFLKFNDFFESYLLINFLRIFLHLEWSNGAYGCCGQRPSAICT